MGMDAELDAWAREMRERFYVPEAVEDTLAGFDALASQLHPDYKPVAAAFRQNLASFVTTVAMPFTLASSSVHERHFQRIHIAARIRAGGIGKDGDKGVEEARDRAAAENAHKQMREFLGSKDGKNVVIRDICHFLRGSLQQGLLDGASELLRQGVILLWSAFEVFFRDVFELHLNRKPTRIKALISQPDTRKRFDAEKLPLETLMDYGFDISAKLGSILLTRQDFSDLRAIKTVYRVIFPSAGNLIASLGSRDLWVLFQRRHLIVHRRGVVDKGYIDETGESLPVGSQIAITPASLENDLKVVLSCGEALCESLCVDSPAV